MQKHNNRIICGKRDGPAYKDMVRPIETWRQHDWFCSFPYRECSDYTGYQNTVCYDTRVEGAEENCPITDIKVVETKALQLTPNLNRYEQ